MRRCVLFAIAAVALSATWTAHGREQKIRALLITGQNNHNWRETTPHIKQFLDATGKIQVDVTEDPRTTLADAARLREYQVFVLNFNAGRGFFGDAGDANFLDAIRNGTGVSVIHAANNAFNGWADYDRLVGIAWREGAGHGPYHEFTVKVSDREHPITRGLADFQAHPDELYHRLRRAEGEEMRILMSAFSEVTQQDEPMALVKQFGKGRVFHTPMGHDLRAMRDPNFMLLVARGTEWAATGKVTIQSLMAGR